VNPLIRRAEERDLEDIARLLCQVENIHADGRPDLFRHGERKYNDAELREIVSDDTRPVFVATMENRVAGYVFCIHQNTDGSATLIPTRDLYVDDLCVDEDARGQGIGRSLYRFVESYARETSCDRITLNVWCLNDGAMRFYERIGLSPLKITMEQKL
jgi:ribosomal protein S18 acetylase RimI-like enzyme